MTNFFTEIERRYLQTLGFKQETPRRYGLESGNTSYILMVDTSPGFAPLVYLNIIEPSGLVHRRHWEYSTESLAHFMERWVPTA